MYHAESDGIPLSSVDVFLLKRVRLAIGSSDLMLHLTGDQCSQAHQ